MQGLLKHPIRVTLKLLWFAAELLFAAAKYPLRNVLYPAGSRLQVQARWLQSVAQRLVRILNPHVQVQGPIPKSGILISNHTGYVDILVLSSLTPAVFVAKREIESWPVFGWYARKGGTLFVHREKRSDVVRLNQEMEEALSQGVLLVVFPEGTSSDGRGVLPFKTPLLEPAARNTRPLHAAGIRYHLNDGSAAEEVAFWQEVPLMSHVINLLSKQSVEASVHFTGFPQRGLDRKELARQLHAEVMRLKDA